MSLSYYPRPGEILICHYDDRAIAPEMVKSRPVVVVGPRLRRRGRLVTIVPLSTTIPEPIETYHCIVELESALPAPFDRNPMWAKCDMVTSVALDRLDRFKEPRAPYGGARRWSTGQLTQAQLRDVRLAMLHGLGFDPLPNWI